VAAAVPVFSAVPVGPEARMSVMVAAAAGRAVREQPEATAYQAAAAELVGIVVLAVLVVLGHLPQLLEMPVLAVGEGVDRQRYLMVQVIGWAAAAAAALACLGQALLVQQLAPHQLSITRRLAVRAEAGAELHLM